MVDQRPPVFVHAWWRSSSTYIWSKLREDRSLCCYYEPLHQQLAALDPAAIRSATEATVSRHLRHPLPDRHSFAEYFEFDRPANALYTAALAYDRYLLRPDQEDSQLRAYLNDLVEISRRAGRLPVLCFCRSQMRSAWMKQALGGHHVAQIRDPMAQWDSFHVRPYFVRRLVHIAGKLHGEFPMAFAHIEEFSRQARAASASLSAGGDVPHVSIVKRDALRLFLLLWLASTLQAVGACDLVLDADRLSAEPAYQRESQAWFRAAGCRVDFSDCATPAAAVPDARRATAFRERIDEAVRALRSQAPGLVLSDDGIVARRLSSLSAGSRRVLETWLAG